MELNNWIYKPSADGASRFVLGTIGENPLICFGVNPSTAVPGEPDPTVRRVMGFAKAGGFDSWMMLNLYPQISTDPNGMHRVVDAELKAGNEKRIVDALEGRSGAVLAAWGGVIEKRRYLPALLRDIVGITTSAGFSWLSIGEPLPAGHPRHPSRAKTVPLQDFDMSAYLLSLR